MALIKCPDCGKEVSDKSNACIHCGCPIVLKFAVTKNLEKEYLKKNGVDESSIDTVMPKEKGHPYLIALVIILLFIASIFFIIESVYNDDSSGRLFDNIVQREIRSTDYEIATSQGITSYTITITAKTSIDEFTVSCTLYDVNNERIYSDTMTKTNLIDGASYTYVFDYGFIKALSGSYVRYNVTGKC